VIAGQIEQVLAYQCMADKLPPFELEYRFSKERRFRLDIAFPPYKVGVEVDGGVFSRQAHGSITGILRDMEKHNLLVLEGWRVLRYTPAAVKSGEAIKGLKRLLLKDVA
jgi:very-short-patch-repair endonuclease